MNTHIMTEEEFNVCIKRVWPKLFGFALKLTDYNEEYAKDLLQDALLKAWKSRHSFDPSTHFVTWFCTITINKFREEYRKKQRRQHYPLLNTYTQTLPFYESNHAKLQLLIQQNTNNIDIYELFEDAIVNALLALKKINESFYETILLIDICGFSQKEVAKDILCISFRTLRTRLGRARLFLCKHLKNYARKQGIKEQTIQNKLKKIGKY